MRIALVRHGQTDWNAAQRVQGATDVPLNDRGRIQAQEAGERLRDEGDLWEGVVASPLDRASVTAEIIADVLGLPMLGTYDDLAERQYGVVEGLNVFEARKQYSVGGEWVGPGVELFEHLQERALRAIDLAATEHPIDGLLIVAHGTLIRSVVDLLTGERTQSIPNAASVRLEGEPGRWSVTAGIVPADA
ncbi:histidine phosphatase family protein [Agrococcus casei]|uniref:Phosphoglycerate mutase n=1 Tax=Agrococcus casei LMG 22410 TaxID=1255656 RepID=A0A1R4G8X8_9MICO|nr:histidine phosphatase family protein [Agrococcus casei]SJM64629.1 Phosphoglycerate mutase [Agrococcus casei LMG 22410]